MSLGSVPEGRNATNPSSKINRITFDFGKAIDSVVPSSLFILFGFDNLQLRSLLIRPTYLECVDEGVPLTLQFLVALFPSNILDVG